MVEELNQIMASGEAQGSFLLRPCLLWLRYVYVFSARLWDSSARGLLGRKSPCDVFVQSNVLLGGVGWSLSMGRVVTLLRWTMSLGNSLGT